MPNLRHIAVAIVALICLGTFASPILAQDETEAQEPTEVEKWVDLMLPDTKYREDIVSSLSDAGDNWPELADALLDVASSREYLFDDTDLGNLVWQLSTAPHLDRLELTAAILTANLDAANRAAERMGYDRDSDFFRRYVLNYRLDQEPVTSWRTELESRYFNEDATLEELVDAITGGLTKMERGYYGNMADPVTIDNSRAGTGSELSLLTAAALRACGYGTRFTSENRTGTSWVEVYTGNPREYETEGWTPVYPLDPGHTGEYGYAMQLCEGSIAVVTAGDAFGREQVTGRYTTTGAVTPVFFKDGSLLEAFEHWSINAWHDGSYIPLDDLGYEVPGTDTALPQAGETAYYIGAPGKYRLVAGMRYPQGHVHVVTHDFSIDSGDDIRIELTLDTPADIPEAALVERTVTIPEDDPLYQAGTFIFLVHDDSEPSVRAMDALMEYMLFSSLLYNPIDINNADGELLAFVTDVLKVTEDDQLPVVIVIRDNETELYLRGYNTNVADWVKRVLNRPASE